MLRGPASALFRAVPRAQVYMRAGGGTGGATTRQTSAVAPLFARRAGRRGFSSKSAAAVPKPPELPVPGRPRTFKSKDVHRGEYIPVFLVAGAYFFARRHEEDVDAQVNAALAAKAARHPDATRLMEEADKATKRLTLLRAAMAVGMATLGLSGVVRALFRKDLGAGVVMLAVTGVVGMELAGMQEYVELIIEQAVDVGMSPKDQEAWLKEAASDSQ